MISLRSVAITAATLASVALGIGTGAQACGDWGHTNTYRSSYTSGPAVYGYYSGDRGSRDYRANNRKSYVQISSNRNDYGQRRGRRDRAMMSYR
jgi:hypothetical protein